MANYKIGYGAMSGKPYLKIPNLSNMCVRLFDPGRSYITRNATISWIGNINRDIEPEDFALEHLKLIDIKALDLSIVRQHLKAALEECLDAHISKKNQDSP